MTTTTVPKSTQTKLPSKNKKNFNAVIDLGNHWIKAYVEGYEKLREPSWIAKCLTTTSPKLPGHVRYISGDCSRLVDKCWLVGQRAVTSGSADIMRLVDDYTGKSSLWLEYFLGILAHLPQPNAEMNFRVDVTCNDVKRHEPIIRQYEGLHVVELAGNPATIKIKINHVLPEGIAALKSQKLEGAVTICDIGGGNVTVTRFFNAEMTGSVMVKNFGAESLMEKLESNSSLKAKIKQAPSKDVINRSIEAGIKAKKSESGEKIPHLYYGESDINFYPEYESELQEFITCNLREVIKILENNKLEGDQILVIGGGSKLPLLSPALKKKGFVISDNGTFDNLLGLIKEQA